MQPKRFIVEMDSMLAELLKNAGQMKIIEEGKGDNPKLQNDFRKDYDNRESTQWEVFAGDRCEYKGRSKDAALETYSKFLAYSRGSENHSAYKKTVKVMKDGVIYMVHKAK